VFPAYHPRKGEPTYFVEKIWRSMSDQGKIDTRGFYEKYDLPGAVH
jgi:hypothetical protein